MIGLKKNLSVIKEFIAQYEKKYAREQNSVTLLAVSKGQSALKIRALFEAGHPLFGENYLQEALAKMQLLSDTDIEWHFIGRIQRNKTRKIAEHFSWVHSLSDLKIAERLHHQRPSHLPPLNLCVEVNVSAEKTKSGIPMDEASAFCKACLSFSNLRLRGLMTMPAPHKNITHQRAAFRKLFSLKKHIEQEGILLDTLSMGTSDDYEAAIAEGATFIRLGKTLFGPRN